MPSDDDVVVPAQVATAFLELLTEIEQCFAKLAHGTRADLDPVLAVAKRCRRVLEQHMDTAASPDPGFGVDPKDSARLLELRLAIDTHLGWSSPQAEQEGNYVGRIREVGEALQRAPLDGLLSHEATIKTRWRSVSIIAVSLSIVVLVWLVVLAFHGAP